MAAQISTLDLSLSHSLSCHSSVIIGLREDFRGRGM